MRKQTEKVPLKRYRKVSLEKASATEILAAAGVTASEYRRAKSAVASAKQVKRAAQRRRRATLAKMRTGQTTRIATK